MKHVSVLLEEVLKACNSLGLEQARIADLTAGAGGHFFSLLDLSGAYSGVCVDRDPDAHKRLLENATLRQLDQSRWTYIKGQFSSALEESEDTFDFILADLGISSFQIDDPSRGMSFKSKQVPDFRMDPDHGESFADWLLKQSIGDLEFIFEEYAEEPRAKKLAHAMKSASQAQLESAEALSEFIKDALGYKHSKRHPAARIFQAFRIEINDELGELKRMLKWAPAKLNQGGILALITFHSLEDRIVKNTFKTLAAKGPFDILTKKPIVPSEEELKLNSRSRSAKLRLLKKL